MLSIVLPLIFFSVLYLYLRKNYTYWAKKGVKYLKPSLPFGNFQDVIFVKSSIGEFLYDIYKRSTGDVIGFWVFSQPALLVRSPDLLRNILVKDFSYFDNRSVVSEEKIDSISAKMLFLLKNPEWKSLRSNVSPIFTASKIKSMMELIDRAAGDFKDFLKGNEGVLDAKESCARFTTDVITSCAFGLNSKCFDMEEAEFRVAGRKLVDTTLTNSVRFTSYFLVPAMVKMFKIRFFDPSAIGFLKGAFIETIAERERSGAKRNDLIDIILQMKKKGVLNLDGDDAVAHAIQFFVAGYETTSTTIAFTLYELCLNETIQKKVRAEINEIYETEGSFSYESLQNAKYLDKVIAETLRKYPTLPFLDRRCGEDYKLPGAKNVVIEKGTPIYISILGLHFDPEYFPEPEKYDPERFSEENAAKRPTYAYLPFGHGPRNCIGARFGVVTSKLCVAHILREFRVEKCEKTPLKIEYNPTCFVLSPMEKLMIRFVKINQNK